MALRILVLALALSLLELGVGHQHASAAFDFKVSSQVCHANGISVGFSWQRTANTFPTHFWLDLSDIDASFEEGTYVSSSPITLTRYIWTGLPEDTYYFVRLNEPASDGSTISTPVTEFRTENCVPPPRMRQRPSEPISLNLLGFATRFDAGRENLSKPDSVLGVCTPEYLFAFVKVSSLAFASDRNYSWYVDGEKIDPPSAAFFVSSADLVAVFWLPMLETYALTATYMFKLSAWSAETEGSVQLYCP